MPVVLTPEIKELVNNGLASGNPLLPAAVTSDSKPLLSFRGSTQVYSDGQLGLATDEAERERGFWGRRGRSTDFPQS
jgi:hypothetical protein